MYVTSFSVFHTEVNSEFWSHFPSNNQITIRYSDHDLNRGPLSYQTNMGHTNTGLVLYSDPHCSCTYTSKQSVTNELTPLPLLA